MWAEFGFKQNLYDTHPIKGNELGARLLVGRNSELELLKRGVRYFDSVTTVEGPNGVGKTSLVLVAGYQIEKETNNNGRNSIILCPSIFQFSSDETALELKRKVYAAIATHFIENETEYRSRLDLQYNLSPLRGWLENPLFTNIGGSILGQGLQGGRSPNTSSGFDMHGFFNVVDRLLSAAFTAEGGILCILDNLEILRTSQAARQRLEELRDDLFAKHGIKWVVCGARGITRSLASSVRLQGRLQEPYEIRPLRSDSMGDLINARVNEYANSINSTPPVGATSFNYIFEILNSNLRDALKFSGDFCLWLIENGSYTNEQTELDKLFEIWLAEQSDKYQSAVRIPPRSWKLFDQICNQGGSISPTDYPDFGYETTQGMRSAVTPLETEDMVFSEADETDHRRKTISVTAKGWLIRHHRSGYGTGCA